MLKCRNVGFALIPLLFSGFLAAADINGKWKGQIEGGEHEAIFTLKVDGSSVTGTMSHPGGKEYPLKGTLDGNKIAFTFESEWEGSPVKVNVKGTVEGDEMNLTLTGADGDWSVGMTARRV